MPVDRAPQLASSAPASSGRSSPIAANAIRARRSSPVHAVSVPPSSTRDRRERLDGPALLRAQQRPLGPVDDVALGDAHVPGEHELLLDDVLDGLDRHVRGPERVRVLSRSASAAAGSELHPSDRNALRIAASIFPVLQPATSPERRISRTLTRADVVGRARRSTSAFATS